VNSTTSPRLTILLRSAPRYDPSQVWTHGSHINNTKIEFYFSAQNLATDEHMFEVLEGPKNTPVSINHICTFKRMRRFKPYSAVVKALRDSKDLIVVDDGEYSEPGSEAVKRKEALVMPAKEGDDGKNPPTTQELFYRLKHGSSNNMETSAYVKGFGSEEDAGQIALEQFFRPYGSVMVRKRREDDGSWKGSAFVEFDTEESQKQFLALDPKPKFNGNELVTMGKKEYAVMKCAEKGIKPDWELTEEERAEQKKTQREANGDRHRSRGNDRNDRNRGGRGNRGSSRGGRGGRDRGDNRDNRDRRDRNRSRSPRRRRDSSGSLDSRDWKERRNRFKDGKDDRGSSKQEKKEIERDAHGVPVVKDSRTDAEIAASSTKRKADDDNGAASPKKSKLEIKQDE
jgi:lupus La protein